MISSTHKRGSSSLPYGTNHHRRQSTVPPARGENRAVKVTQHGATALANPRDNSVDEATVSATAKHSSVADDVTLIGSPSSSFTSPNGVGSRLQSSLSLGQAAAQGTSSWHSQEICPVFIPANTGAAEASLRRSDGLTAPTTSSSSSAVFTLVAFLQCIARQSHRSLVSRNATDTSVVSFVRSLALPGPSLWVGPPSIRGTVKGNAATLPSSSARHETVPYPFEGDVAVDRKLRSDAVLAVQKHWHVLSSVDERTVESKRSSLECRSWSVAERYAAVWDPMLGCVVVRWHDRRAGKLLQRALSAIASAVRVSLLPDVFAVPPSVTCAHRGELLTVLWLPSLCASEPLDVADERSCLCRPAVQLLSGLLRGNHHSSPQSTSTSTGGGSGAVATPAAGAPLVDVYPGSPCTYWLFPSAEFLRIARSVPSLPGSLFLLGNSQQPLDSDDACGTSLARLRTGEDDVIPRRSVLVGDLAAGTLVNRMATYLMRMVLSQTPVPPDRGGFLHSVFHLHGVPMRSLLDVRRVLLEHVVEDGCPSSDRIRRIKKDVETLLLSEAVARVLKTLVLLQGQKNDVLTQLVQRHHDGTMGIGNTDVDSAAMTTVVLRQSQASLRSLAGSSVRRQNSGSSTISSVLEALRKERAAGSHGASESLNLVRDLCGNVTSRSALVLHLFINASDFVVDVVGQRLAETFLCTCAMTVDLKRDVAVADVTCVLRYLLGLDEFFAESLRCTQRRDPPPQCPQLPTTTAQDATLDSLAGHVAAPAAPGSSSPVDVDSVSVLWCFCYGGAGVERVYLPRHAMTVARPGGSAEAHAELTCTGDAVSTVLALIVSSVAIMHYGAPSTAADARARILARCKRPDAVSEEERASCAKSSVSFSMALVDVARITFSMTPPDSRSDSRFAVLLLFLRLGYPTPAKSPPDERSWSFLVANEPKEDVAEADRVWVADHLCRLIEVSSAVSSELQPATTCPSQEQQSGVTAVNAVPATSCSSTVLQPGAALQPKSSLVNAAADALVTILVQGSTRYRGLGKSRCEDDHTRKSNNGCQETIPLNFSVPFLAPRSFLSQLIWNHVELFSTAADNVATPPSPDSRRNLRWLTFGRSCVLIAAAASNTAVPLSSSAPPTPPAAATTSSDAALRDAWWSVATTVGPCVPDSAEQVATVTFWWSSCWALLVSAIFILHDGVAAAALVRQEDPLSWLVACVVLPAAFVESMAHLPVASADLSGGDSSLSPFTSWVAKIGRECCRRHCARLLLLRHGMGSEESVTEHHGLCHLPPPPSGVSHWNALLQSDALSSREWLALLQNVAFYGGPSRPTEPTSLRRAAAQQSRRREHKRGSPIPAAAAHSLQRDELTTVQLVDRVARVVRQAASYWLAAVAASQSDAAVADATPHKSGSFTFAGLCCCSEACWMLRTAACGRRCSEGCGGGRSLREVAAVPIRKGKSTPSKTESGTAPVRLPPLILHHGVDDPKRPHAPRSDVIQTDRTHDRCWRRKRLVEPMPSQPAPAHQGGGRDPGVGGGDGDGKWSVYLNPQRRRYLQHRGQAADDILAVASAVVLLPPYSSRLLPALRHGPHAVAAPQRRPSDETSTSNTLKPNSLPPLDI